MRQIGTLPRQIDPNPLTNHLMALGFSSRVDERPDGWVIWIFDENHLAEARQEFTKYLENPNDPRFSAALAAADAARREHQRKEEEYRRNVRDLKKQWDRPNLRRRPLTTALVIASVAVYFLMRSPAEGERILELFLFSTFPADATGNPSFNLEEITRQGQVWRLITPIFLHFSEVHLIFNMMALWVLGSLIETRRGTGTLALVVFGSAIISNSGQFVYQMLTAHPSAFGGMSGVDYALFGYLWLKGKVQPEQGIILNPSYVQSMLFWLVLCMTGYVGHIANTAHVVGLVIGALLGLARF